MEAIRNGIVEEHNKLIQQLETTYLNYLNVLFKQKALIHEQIQKSLYQKLFELNDMINHKTNCKPLTILPINSLSLPTLEYNIENNSNIMAFSIAGKKCVICDKHCRNENEYALHIQYHSTKKDMQESEMSITKEKEKENNKKTAESFKTKGNKLLKDKKYQRAIIEYTKAIKLDPVNAVFFCNRAAAYTNLKSYQQAAINARKASDIDPYYVKAYMREGVAEYAMKHYQKAYDAYSKAIDINKFKQHDKNRKTYKQIEARIKLCQMKMNEININELPYECKKCGKLFKQQQDLTKHLSRHNGSMQFLCSECHKPFKDLKDLKKHMKCHSERLFKCSECFKVFKRKTELSNHMSVHSSEKPYQCSECEVAFKRKGNLDRHIRKHFGDKLY